jgi:hypothetical protein
VVPVTATPVGEVDREGVPRALAAVLTTAWQSLEDARQSVLAAFRAGHKTPALLTLLATFKDAIATFLATVDAAVSDFVHQQLPALYQLGAEHAAVAVGTPFTWSAPHTRALSVLAAEVSSGFRQRAREAARLGAAWYRAARQAARGGSSDTPSAEGPSTAARAATALASGGLAVVVYRGGARMPVGAWAEAAALAAAAVAFNSGTLAHAADAGASAVEVFDGAECGWSSHQDPDKASGTVRSIRDAAQMPISHPRCQRAFAPLAS